MKPDEKLQALVQLSGKKSLYTTMNRYILVLNNYVKGRKISEIEKKNHENNHIRKHYLSLLSEALGIPVDFQSPLFEGRLESHYSNDSFFYNDDSYLYKRIKERESSFIKKGLEINKESFSDMVKMGSLEFNLKYKTEEK